MTTATTEQVRLFDTQCIAGLLNDRYPVATVKSGRIRLRTPACTLNAADWLRRQGIDATSRCNSGMWEIEV